jgi:hypothetical protein
MKQRLCRHESLLQSARIDIPSSNPVKRPTVSSSEDASTAQLQSRDAPVGSLKSVQSLRHILRRFFGAN